MTENPAVRRVPTGTGSEIDPPLDDSWDDLTKLRWHLAATLLDASLAADSLSVQLMRGGYGSDDGFPMYQLGRPGYCMGPLSYTAMWDVINGVEFGARAAQEAA